MPILKTSFLFFWYWGHTRQCSAATPALCSSLLYSRDDAWCQEKIGSDSCKASTLTHVLSHQSLKIIFDPYFFVLLKRIWMKHARAITKWAKISIHRFFIWKMKGWETLDILSKHERLPLVKNKKCLSHSSLIWNQTAYAS